MKQILTLKAFETFNHSSIFDKAVLYLGEKQGVLVNDECSSCIVNTNVQQSNWKFEHLYIYLKCRWLVIKSSFSACKYILGQCKF